MAMTLDGKTLAISSSKGSSSPTVTLYDVVYAENGTPIVGLPGCVMYSKRTIFDLVLPRLIADDEVTAEELAGLGEGGLCLNCKVCTFPNCGFGKGR